MHLLFLVPWYPGTNDPGFGIFFTHQANALAERYEVTVVHVVVHSALNLRFRPFNIEVSTEGKVRVVRVETTNFLPKVPGGYEWVFAAATRRALEFVYQTLGPIDMIHGNGLWPVGMAAVRAGQLLNAPVVICEHSYPRRLLKTRTSIKSALAAAKRADAVLAVSPSLRDEIASTGIERHIELFPPLVNTAVFNPAPKGTGDQLRLLFAGQMDDDSKGVPDLLLAVSILKSWARPFRLVLAGKGRQIGRYIEIARDLEILGHCEFRGQVNSSEIARLMRECHIFVLPSLVETFGVVLIEALASGRPVVATRCGGPEFIVTPAAGELCAPSDPHSLAKCISRVADRLDSYDPTNLHVDTEGRFGQDAFLNRATRLYECLLESTAQVAP